MYVLLYRRLMSCGLKIWIRLEPSELEEERQSENPQVWDDEKKEKRKKRQTRKEDIK